MIHKTAVALVLATSVCGGAAQDAKSAAPIPSVTLPADVARVLTDYERAWSGRDARALAAPL